MSKLSFWALLSIGIYLVVSDLMTPGHLMGPGWCVPSHCYQKGPFITLGVLLLVLAGFIALRPGGFLRKEEVIDKWFTLIEGAQGKADTVFERLMANVKDSQAPFIAITEIELSPGFMRSMMGHRRQFLRVESTTDSKVSAFKMYVNARDYGNNLAVDWYVVFRPSVMRAIWAALLFWTTAKIAGSGKSFFLDLDLFDDQDLRAMTTNAHRCLLQAVDELMLSLSLDPAKIERRSRGFLGVS